MLFLLLSVACSPKTITETIYVDRLIYVQDSGGGDSQAGDSEPDSEGTDSELVDSQAGDSEPDSAADSADSQAGDSGDSHHDSHGDSGDSSSSNDSDADSGGDSGDSQAGDSGGDSGDSGGPVCDPTVDPQIIGMNYSCTNNIWTVEWELAGEADRVVLDGMVHTVYNGSAAGSYTFQLSSDDGSVETGCCGSFRLIADCTYAFWVGISPEVGGATVDCGYTGNGGGNTTCGVNRWQPTALGCP